jgi:hypothetical protein
MGGRSVSFGQTTDHLEESQQLWFGEPPVTRVGEEADMAKKSKKDKKGKKGKKK